MDSAYRPDSSFTAVLTCNAGEEFLVLATVTTPTGDTFTISSASWSLVDEYGNAVPGQTAVTLTSGVNYPAGANANPVIEYGLDTTTPVLSSNIFYIGRLTVAGEGSDGNDRREIFEFKINVNQ